MWHWDQGRLDYFQFDAIRKIGKFALNHDLKAVDVDGISESVGLPFLPRKDGYKPWRNYSRTFKLSLLATGDGNASRPTAIAQILSDDGKITTDEYFHFLAEATTDPSPALRNWDSQADLRFPLLFALRFLLARAGIGIPTTSLAEVVAAYSGTELRGDEGQVEFLNVIQQDWPVLLDVRQANESLRVLSQISYLSLDRTSVFVSLDKEDALEIFEQLSPITGVRLENGDDEIQRIANLYEAASAELDFEYGNTIVSDTVEAGFLEGGRIARTHIKIERNGKLREAFFNANPSAMCDLCGNDTQSSYPWAEKILDIHHVLPLCSGTRTSRNGTVLDDLVANCPTCHRAVHRYYGQWLKDAGKKDFEDAFQARGVYVEAKNAYQGPNNASQ